MKAKFIQLKKTLKGVINSNKSNNNNNKDMKKKEIRIQDDDLISLSSTLFLPDDDDGLSYSNASSISNNTKEYLPHYSSYSNFYYKLPNGNWLVQYRTRDEVVINSFEINGNLI